MSQIATVYTVSISRALESGAQKSQQQRLLVFIRFTPEQGQKIRRVVLVVASTRTLSSFGPCENYVQLSIFYQRSGKKGGGLADGGRWRVSLLESDYVHRLS